MANPAGQLQADRQGAPVKISPADQAFAKCVKWRVNWVCESCGKQYEEGSQGLHCSHFFSRRHRATRWHPDNAAAHCFSCHQKLGGNPVEFYRWIENHLGAARLQIVEDLKNSIIKIPKSEEKEIARHYREELKRLKDRRDSGETGYLEFEGWQ